MTHQLKYICIYNLGFILGLLQGRVLGIAQEVFFEVFEVFDVGTLFLEDLNS
jgi:hypothetical protein